MAAPVAVRPQDLGYRIAELAAVSPTGRIEFRIQAQLRSPNVLLGRHWREKHRERKAWQAHLTNALVMAIGMRAAQRLLIPESGLHGATGVRCSARRRVEVVRFAPARRNLIRDDDNLRFCVKPLLDALKQLGLIRDDRRGWIDLPVPTQELSKDGTFWSWIAIDAVPPLEEGKTDV